jgi:hypothetical protein
MMNLISEIMKVDMSSLIEDTSTRVVFKKNSVNKLFPLLCSAVLCLHIIMSIIGEVPVFCVIITPAFLWIFYLIINTSFRFSIKNNDFSMIAGYKGGSDSLEVARRKLINIDLFSGIFALICELLFFLVYFDERKMFVSMCILGVYLSFVVVIIIIVNKNIV